MARRAERTVVCLHCGAERATRAQKGVRLACTSCGEMFRCPAPDDSAEVLHDGSAAAPGDASPSPADDASPAGGLPEGFEEATIDVRQNARPRSRGAGDESHGTEADPSPPAAHDGSEDEDWQQQLGPRASRESIRPTNQRRAQRAGRKGGRSGGLGMYKGMTG